MLEFLGASAILKGRILFPYLYFHCNNNKKDVLEQHSASNLAFGKNTNTSIIPLKVIACLCTKVMIL